MALTPPPLPPGPGTGPAVYLGVQVDKSAAMGDFGDSEWKHMLCVEPGFVSTWRRLAAGQEVMLRQVLRASL